MTLWLAQLSSARPPPDSDEEKTMATINLAISKPPVEVNAATLPHEAAAVLNIHVQSCCCAEYLEPHPRHQLRKLVHKGQSKRIVAPIERKKTL